MKPTKILILKHRKTNLRYLCKTTSAKKSYKGSGVYWCNHLSKHGRDVSREWESEWFTDKDLLEEFALFLSEELQVAESNEWANLKPENGLDGGDNSQYVDYQSPNHSNKRKAREGRHHWQTEEYSKKASEKAKEKLKKGTHNFIGINEKRLQEGRHNLKGTVTCRDREGKVVQVPKDVYQKIKNSKTPDTLKEFVMINTIEGKRRKR